MMSFKTGVAALAMALTGSAAYAKPVTAVLRLQEKVAMSSLAEMVKNPISVRYNKPFGPDEIREMSAPAQADYDQLVANLQARGFEIVNQSPTHLYLTVKAPAKTFESAFATRLEQLGHGLHRQMSQPQIPSDLSLVASITGLDNSVKRFPKHVRSAVQPMGSPTGFTPAQIKTAYGFDAVYAKGLTGKGQHIDIATYDGFYVADVQQFYSLQGINPAPAVDTVSFNGTAAYVEGSAMETQLDAEFSGMIAPGAQIHVFASAENSDAGELAMFTAILDDNRAKIANYSWGGCETTVTAAHQTEMEAVFARAVAQGVNIMVASGDSGSDSCQDGTNKADWPAANDNVVAVGGTTLTIGSDGSGTEAAWSGSGGGISALWNLPAWQQSLGTPYVKRSYPDVAFNADPASGQSIYAHNNGVADWIQIGGTSMAAPQWSGFMALIGEARANAGKAAVGYLPPQIYALSTTDKAAMFHDVTSGANGLYTAGPGWDAVTGWGSMNASALLTKLSN
jgi:kumamolisin